MAGGGGNGPNLMAAGALLAVGFALGEMSGLHIKNGKADGPLLGSEI